MKGSIVAIAVVAALASAAVAAGRPAGSLPGNLCALNVKQQLKPLPLGSTTCKPGKTVHLGPVAIEGADWGTTNHAVALQIFENLSKSRFMAQIAKSTAKSPGTKVKVSLGNGKVGWLSVGASGVGVEAWIGGYGMMTLLITPPQSPKTNKKYAAAVLAFVKAVAKQI